MWVGISIAVLRIWPSHGLGWPHWVGSLAFQLVSSSMGQILAEVWVHHLTWSNLTWDIEKVSCQEESCPNCLPVAYPHLVGSKGAQTQCIMVQRTEGIFNSSQSMSGPEPQGQASLPKCHDQGLSEFPPDPRTGRPSLQLTINCELNVCDPKKSYVETQSPIWWHSELGLWKGIRPWG